jgi:hypothetical protein
MYGSLVLKRYNEAQPCGRPVVFCNERLCSSWYVRVMLLRVICMLYCNALLTNRVG